MRARLMAGAALFALLVLTGCGGGSKSDGGSSVDATRQAAIVAEQIQRFQPPPGEETKLSNVTCQPGAGTYACDATWDEGDTRQIQITATLTGNNYFQATSPQVQQDFSASGTIPTDTAYRGLYLKGLKVWSDAHAVPAAGYQPSPDAGCKVGKVDRTFYCEAFDGNSNTDVGFRVAADGRATIASYDPQATTPPNAGKDLGFLPKDFK